MGELIFSIGSFDIGTRNLGLCILDKLADETIDKETQKTNSFQIHDWQLISLTDQVGDKKKTCCSQLRKRKKDDPVRVCGLAAKFQNPSTSEGYCQKHAQQAEKQDMTMVRYTTTKNMTDLELYQKLVTVLEGYPSLWTRCHEVVIEGQMRSNMKKVTCFVFSFLADQIRKIERGELVGQLRNVKIVHASHKLKLPLDKMGVSLETGLAIQSGIIEGNHIGRGNKPTRKNLGKYHCQLLIAKDRKQLTFFENHKKKDDLADCFLQGLWYMFR